MNSSILGILIATAITFLAGCSVGLRQGFGKPCQVLLLGLGLSLCILLKARAATAGLAAGMFCIFPLANKRKLYVRSLVLAVPLLLVLVLVKLPSSKGRLLIYKISFSQLMTKDVIYGTGPFAARYNVLQANYFSKQPNLNTEEALLADNIVYLYNDWLQWAIELGLVGVIVWAFALWLFFRVFERKPVTQNSKLLQKGINGALVCMGVAALFSFPLHHPVAQPVFLALLAVYLFKQYCLKAEFRRPSFIYVLAGLRWMALLVFIAYQSAQVYNRTICRESFRLRRSGDLHKALLVLNRLDVPFLHTAGSLFQKAQLLYDLGRSAEALPVLKKSMGLQTGPASAALLGDIYFDMRDTARAFVYYRQAVFMTPHHIRPKFRLMLHYSNIGDIENARYWARKILSMPIKIPSGEADDLLSQTKIFLRKHEN